MDTPETIKVTVTEIPRATLDRILQAAIENGLSPNSYPAAIRWALAQYDKILNGPQGDTD